MSTAVAATQRYTRSRRCPICRGAEADPRGQEQRCIGYLSGDGEYARCSRAEHAGALPIEDATATYVHRLVGVCRCGARHGTEDAPPSRRPDFTGGPVAEWDYFDAGRALVFRVQRFNIPGGDKRFSQRRPDGKGGWISNLQGVRRVLYRLPELLEANRAEVVYIAEGEQCVDALRTRGLVSTTNSGGTGGGSQWDDPEFREPLRGRVVVVLPDVDEDGKGRKHAEHVARALAGVAGSVKLLDLPGLQPRGEDVVDWLARGGTAEKLCELATAAPTPSPPSAALANRIRLLKPIPRLPTQFATLNPHVAVNRGSTPNHVPGGVPRGAGGRWLPGASPNPSGRPPKMQACREAIEEARDPRKVGRLLDALFNAGIAGDIAAAKTWLAYCAGPPPRDPDDEPDGSGEGQELPALEPRAWDDGGRE